MTTRTTASILGVLACFGLQAGCSLFGQKGFIDAGSGQMPQLKKQSSPKAVVVEHLSALNHCDWARLMAQYPPEAEFFLPDGQLVKGREEIGKLFAALVKPFPEGLCGAKFEEEHSFTVGDTVSLQWRASADFLNEPYHGADAYITKDGLMWATVTTFQRSELKAK